jgi:hypothetical protein
MGTPYAGADSYPADITLPDGSDADDAATAAIPIIQLADRVTYCKARIDGVTSDFTDAVLHGNTTMPDGTLVATLTAITITCPAIVLNNGLEVTGTLAVTGIVDCSGEVSAASLTVGSGTFGVDSSLANFAGGVPVRMSGRLYLVDDGHIDEQMVDVMDADGNTTKSVNDGEVFWIHGSATAHTHTCANTGANRGSKMRWYCAATTPQTLKQPDGTTNIAVLDFTAAPASGQYYWVDLRYDGASLWRIVGGQRL